MLPINRKLLNKYIQDEYTPEEEGMVLQWLDKNDIEEYPEVHGRKKYDRKKESEWRHLVKRFEELQPVVSKKGFIGRRWMWAAAAVMTGLIIFSAYLFQSGFQLFDRYAAQYQTTYGEVKRITLSDGTTVTLNAQSELKIEKGFDVKNRTVYLDGEAFFEVKHMEEMPFLVITKELTLEDLGTSFNVSAFDNDIKQTVSVKSGKVAVEIPLKAGAKSVILLPGEEVSYNKTDQHIEITRADLKDVSTWQRRIIYFKNANMNEVLRELERFYGVTFDTHLLKPRDWQLTGEYKNQTLKGILESLSFNYGLQYKLEGDTVILTD